MPLTFGPNRRIRRHAEFVRAQRSGRRIGTRHFTMLVSAREADGGPARLGLVVGRKVGNAVQRNRVKRLCRECFRTSPELIPGGIDLVVIARTGAHLLNFEQVRAEWRAVERLLRKRAAEALARRGEAHHLGDAGAGDS